METKGVVKRLVVLLGLLVLPVFVRGQFTYTTNNGTITITAYNGPGGQVVIPNSTNGLPVTSIGDVAFANRWAVTNLTFPNSLTNIRPNAFIYCTNLVDFTLPNGLLNIGDAAFAYCSRLTNIAVPASVTRIGVSAFFSCLGLTNITVAQSNLFYSSLDGVLFNKNQTRLIQYPATKAGNYAIPPGVGTVDAHAFDYCTNLTGVTIPGGVSIINAGTFRGCSKLSDLTIPTGVLSIGADSFANCECLTNLTIPSTVTNIGELAFNACFRLAYVNLSNGVLNIGDHAFSYCRSLTNITLPSSLASFGFQVFACSTNLASISVETPNAFFSSVGGVLFNQDQTTLIQYPIGRVGSYTIPDTVTRIGNSAFYSVAWTASTFETKCPPNLSGIVFGKNVADIGASAFESCVGLTNLVLPASITNIETTAFFACTNLTSVYFMGDEPNVDFSVFYGVPEDQLVLYYLPQATGWEDVVAYRPTMLWNPQIQTGDSNFGPQSNGFGFNISGTADIPILIEASSDLGNPHWDSLQSCKLTNGAVYFLDANWTNVPTRFYRIRSP